MAPLMNAPSVILQLILNLCTISIATCNKFLNQMTPFNGDKIRPRITAKAGGQTFSWLFDTGASIMCMTAQSFYPAFPHHKPRKIQPSHFLSSHHTTRCCFMSSYRFRYISTFRAMSQSCWRSARTTGLLSDTQNRTNSSCRPTCKCATKWPRPAWEPCTLPMPRTFRTIANYPSVGCRKRFSFWTAMRT